MSFDINIKQMINWCTQGFDSEIIRFKNKVIKHLWIKRIYEESNRQLLGQFRECQINLRSNKIYIHSKTRKQIIDEPF